MMLNVDADKVRRLLIAVIDGAARYDAHYSGMYVCQYCGAAASHPLDMVHYNGNLEPGCVVHIAQELLEQLECE